MDEFLSEGNGCIKLFAMASKSPECRILGSNGLRLDGLDVAVAAVTETSCPHSSESRILGNNGRRVDEFEVAVAVVVVTSCPLLICKDPRVFDDLCICKNAQIPLVLNV